MLKNNTLTPINRFAIKMFAFRHFQSEEDLIAPISLIVYCEKG
jgi:hypothetical protein